MVRRRDDQEFHVLGLPCHSSLDALLVAAFTCFLHVPGNMNLMPSVFDDGGVAPAPHPSYTTTRQEPHHAKTHKNYTPAEQAADGGQ